MNKSVFVVLHREKLPFGLLGYEDEEFETVRAFSSYSKAFKYIQTECPDIYRDSHKIFHNKNNTHLYKVEELQYD